MQWNMDPVFLKIGPLSFRWYGLLFATAFISGFSIMKWIYDKEKKDPGELESLFTYIFVGTVAGARLGHCLFYDPVYYLSHPLNIFKIWEGGLASHGGAAGIILAIFLYSKKPETPGFFWILDRIAIPTALGGALIRIGNFFNSEILGIPFNGMWAIVFEKVDQIPRHPVQLYEAMAYLITFALLLSYYILKNKTPGEKFLSGLFLIMVFSSRFFLESFKTGQAAYESGFVISVGQWLSIPFVLTGIYMIAGCLKRKGS